jgi:sugar diacid utilization regulator
MTWRVRPLDPALGAAILGDLDGLVATVAADVGEPPGSIRSTVELIAHLLVETEDVTATIDRLRLDGEAGARAGMLAEDLLDRYLTTLWAVWEARTPEAWDRSTLELLGRRLLHGADLMVAAVASGYRTVDQDLVARDAEARRAFLEELLGSIAVDSAAAARLRRHALRRGVDPDATYRLIAISADRSDADAEAAVGRLALAIGAPSTGERHRPGLRLPQVVGWRGRIVVLVRGEWPGLVRLRAALDTVLGGSSAIHVHDWTAVVGSDVDGVSGLAPALAALVETLRAAERLGHRGWLDHPDELAVERLLLIDDRQLEVVVERELGPILADARMGDELVETLRAYFGAGENMRETARRLGLANRTVAYRLERIKRLLGGPLDGARTERLVVALLAQRILARVAVAS